MADFSSRGPRLGDGALKPEVVAPGVDVTAARAAGTALGTGRRRLHRPSAAPRWPRRTWPAWPRSSSRSTRPGTASSSSRSSPTATVPVATPPASTPAPAGSTPWRHRATGSSPTRRCRSGSYAWPYSDLATTRTPLTYTNTGAHPVTLSLALTGEDGGASPTGVSLSAAHGHRAGGRDCSGRRVARPDRRRPGAYSGGGHRDRRRAAARAHRVGSQLEPERYDVTVTREAARRHAGASHELASVGFGEPGTSSSARSTRTRRPDATFRLPPGHLQHRRHLLRARR